jgi:hypothetical protein
MTNISIVFNLVHESDKVILMMKYGKGEPLTTEKLWLFFKEGKIGPLGVASTSTYKDRFNPLVEILPLTPTYSFQITNWPKEDIEAALLAVYQDLIKNKNFYPGRYGDWMKLTQFTIAGQKYLNIDGIGNGAWIKPTLAADLGIFIKDKQAIYYVGIVRKNEPGKGLPAHIGGIMEAHEELDSAMYTMLKETLEEGNLVIKYAGNVSELRTQYDRKKTPVIVEGFEKIHPKLKNLPAEMIFIATIPTPEIERNADGTKRVYQATGLVTLIDVDDVSLTETELTKVFSAGDDAGSIYISNVTADFNKNAKIKALPVIPKFGLPHHAMLFVEMVKRLRRTYKFQ